MGRTVPGGNPRSQPDPRREGRRFRRAVLRMCRDVGSSLAGADLLSRLLLAFGGGGEPARRRPAGRSCRSAHRLHRTAHRFSLQARWAFLRGLRAGAFSLATGRLAGPMVGGVWRAPPRLLISAPSGSLGRKPQPRCACSKRRRGRCAPRRGGALCQTKQRALLSPGSGRICRSRPCPSRN